MRSTRSGLDDDLAVTLVGDTPVVLDRTSGQVLIGSRAIDLAGGESAELQEPGESAHSVAVATGQALVELPLDGSAAATTDVGSVGDPVAPVRVLGCTYGAWSGGHVERDCAGTSDDVHQDLGVGGSLSLRFRVNRGFVVLNDLAAGTVWMADQEFQKVDNWQDVLPSQAQDATDTESTSADADPMTERNLPNRPPTAVADDFGVRPGRTTLLPALDNDTDPDGDVLRAEVAGAEPAIGRVDSVLDGSALQVTVPVNATGTSSFTYRVDDGRGGDDTATVTLAVHGPGVNGPPAAVRETVVRVESGSSVTVDVLRDWLDPDGDTLYLTGAEVTTPGDSVRYTADGTVTFQDVGTEIGRKAVTVHVSDGTEVVDGTLSVDVMARGLNEPPVAVADHASTTVGHEVTITPLDNDTDPNGDVLQLARVQPDNGSTSPPTSTPAS